MLLAGAWVVWKEFFWVLYRQKLTGGMRKPKNMGHPLDLTFPYKPETVNIYLRFFDLLLGTLLEVVNLSREQSGSQKKPNQIIKESFAIFVKLYQTSSRVYTPWPSTTSRPQPKNFKLLWIYLVDPHTNCLPSLHILVSAFSCALAQHCPAWGIESTKQRDLQSQIWNEATAIGASVLWVKQHSLNCLPAALYVLEKIYPIWLPAYSERYLEAVQIWLTSEGSPNWNFASTDSGYIDAIHLQKNSFEHPGVPGITQEQVANFLSTSISLLQKFRLNPHLDPALACIDFIENYS